MQERNNSLVKQKSEIEIAKPSLPPPLHSATRMLDLAAAKTGKELLPVEMESWMELLAKEPPPAIEFAFKEFFRIPPPDGARKWFPEEWEIMQLASVWKKRQRERKEAERQASERKREEEARAAGKLCSIGEVRAILRETVERIAQKSAEVGMEAKRREDQPRPPRYLSGMNDEEIQRRLDTLREQAEKLTQRVG